LGMTLPDAVLQLLVNRANSIDTCLDANYDENTAQLIKLYLIALFGIASSNKYVTAERAPSGASRSYAFGTLSDGYGQYTGWLGLLDPYGCASGLIPPDPTSTAAAFFVVGGDGCCQ